MRSVDTTSRISNCCAAATSKSLSSVQTSGRILSTARSPDSRLPSTLRTWADAPFAPAGVVSVQLDRRPSTSSRVVMHSDLADHGPRRPCGTFVAHESEKRWFSRLNQRQRTTHEKADFEPSVRGSGALIIRRSRVQVPAAPLVSPQVRTLHAARSDPSPWARGALGAHEQKSRPRPAARQPRPGRHRTGPNRHPASWRPMRDRASSARS